MLLKCKLIMGYRGVLLNITIKHMESRLGSPLRCLKHLFSYGVKASHVRWISK